MKQNMQTVNKHKFKSAQYSYICGDCPTNESQGEAQGGFYMWAKGDYLDWVHSDQMVFERVRQEGCVMWAVAKSNSGRGHQAHQDQMVLVMARQEGWTAV